MSVPVFRFAEFVAGRRQRRCPPHLRNRLLELIRRTTAPSTSPAATPEASFPFVSVIVPVFNAEETLALCLESLERQSWPESCREIIVVDNNSTDQSRAIAARHHVRIVDCPFPGASSARNAGAEAARGEWLAFTDADCVVSPFWLERLVKAAVMNNSENQDRVAFGGEVRGIYFSNSAMRMFGRTAGLLDQWSAISGAMLGLPFVITANALIRRDEFLREGGFDPQLGPAEDAELGWRLHFHGKQMAYVPSARVWHFHRLTASSLHRQFFRYGLNEIRATLKWRNALSPALTSQLFWFRPHEYRLFWKRLLQLPLALAGLQITKFLFIFYLLTAAAGHTAGRLWGHWRCRHMGDFLLYPENEN